MTAAHLKGSAPQGRASTPRGAAQHETGHLDPGAQGKGFSKIQNETITMIFRSTRRGSHEGNEGRLKTSIKIPFPPSTHTRWEHD